MLLSNLHFQGMIRKLQILYIYIGKPIHSGGEKHRLVDRTAFRIGKAHGQIVTPFPVGPLIRTSDKGFTFFVLSGISDHDLILIVKGSILALIAARSMGPVGALDKRIVFVLDENKGSCLFIKTCNQVQRSSRNGSVGNCHS